MELVVVLYSVLEKAGLAKVLERYDLLNSEIKVEKEQGDHEIGIANSVSETFFRDLFP